MHLIGYIASAFIGISLGLIGGGGSILTVPVLVYFFGVSPLAATSYSLFIVGTTSLAGAINYQRKGLVSFKTAGLFGLSSISTVFITRKFLIPIIPKTFGEINGFIISESLVIMILFAILMLMASIKMIRSKKAPASHTETISLRIPILLAYGILIGLVTGFLGAGGGFLIIPTLVLLLNLPMKKAVATSLLIIAMNSLIGFLGDIGHFDIDWPFLTIITIIAITGIFIGSALGKKIEGAQLKKGFGWFVLVMSIFIIIKEIIAG